MKNSVCLLAAIASALTVGAADIVWSGGGAAGDWSDGANWQGGVVPGAGDAAIFQSEATVTLPAAFAGRVRAEGDGVTIKSGGGVMTGEIDVAAGVCTLVGDGSGVVVAAPGAFGRVTVAAGATLMVAESPADLRHAAGVALLARTDNDNDAWTRRFSAGANFASEWTGFLAAEGVEAVNYVATSDAPFIWGDAWMPPNGRGGDNYDVIARALIVQPKGGIFQFQAAADDRIAVALDGGTVFRNTDLCYGCQEMTRLDAGWHVMDVAFGEWGGGVYVNASVTTPDAADIHFGPSRVWRGVCLAGLSVAAGGRVSVPEGQSLVLLGDATALGGTVELGAQSVLALASGSLTLDGAQVAAQAGARVEVGAFGRLDIANLPETPGFSVVGEGVVGAATARATGADFTGTIDLAADGSLARGDVAAGAVRLGGEGTFTDATTLAGAENFEGRLGVKGAVSTTELANGRTTAAVQLGDGAKLTVAQDKFAGAAYALPDWTKWTLGGRSDNTADGIFSGNPAYVQPDGTLVLTDDGGVQRNYAVLGQPFQFGDSFEISFTYSATHDGWTHGSGSNHSWAEGFGLTLTTASDERLASANWWGVEDGAANGFYCYLYNIHISGTPRLAWVDGGENTGALALEAAETGLDFFRPVWFTVRLENRTMTVRMEQDGKSCTLVREFTQLFNLSVSGHPKPCRLLLAGGTAYWGNMGDVPWARQEFSDLTGWMRTVGETQTVDGFFPFSAEGWQLAGSTVQLDGDQLCFNDVENHGLGKNGIAVSKATLPVNRPFVLEFDERLVDSGGDHPAEGLSVFFAPNAASVLDHSTDSASNLEPCAGSTALALGHKYWTENTFRWSVDGGGVVAASGTNPDGMWLSKDCQFHYRIVYDGNGTFAVRVSLGTHVWQGAYTYPNIAAWGETMVVGFMSAPSSWGPWAIVRVLEPSVSFILPGEVAPVRELSVEPTATATLVAGSVGVGHEEKVGLRVPSVTLGAGSTMTLAPGEFDLTGSGDRSIDGFFPFSADGWQVAGTTVQLTGDQLDFNENASNRGNGIAVSKATLPVNRPFVLEFDEALIGSNGTTSGEGVGAEGFSVFFAPNAASVLDHSTNADGQFMPCGGSTAIGFGHQYWNCWFVWGVDGSFEASGSSPNGIGYALGNRYHYQIVYDGKGTFRARVSLGELSYETTRTYPNIAAWGETMVVGFMGAPAGVWDRWTHVRVEAPRISAFQSNAGRTGFALVETEGPSALAVEAGCCVELDRVAATDGTLAVTGDWAIRGEALAFVVDAAAMPRPGSVLAKLPRAAFQGAGEPVFVLEERTGLHLSASWHLTYEGGEVRLRKSGLSVYIR